MHLADLQDFSTIFPSLGKYFQVLHNVLTALECNIKEISQDIPDTTNARCNIFWDGKSQFWSPSQISSNQVSTFTVNIVGVPKKKLCLMGHRGHQESTRDKSRLSFENLRKFPFWWAQKQPIFDKKWLRKMRSKLPTPHGKMALFFIPLKMLHYLNEKAGW